VVDPEHLDGLVPYAVNRDIGQGRKYEFACAFFAPNPTAIRQVFQSKNLLIEPMDGRLPVIRMFILEIFVALFEIGRSGRSQRIRI
jgi:hypothetical protein